MSGYSDTPITVAVSAMPTENVRMVRLMSNLPKHKNVLCFSCSEWMKAATWPVPRDRRWSSWARTFTEVRTWYELHHHRRSCTHQEDTGMFQKAPSVLPKTQGIVGHRVAKQFLEYHIRDSSYSHTICNAGDKEKNFAQEHFGLKSSVCMGHSMGGGICSLFASTFPECVDRLVMLDFVAFGEEFHFVCLISEWIL